MGTYTSRGNFYKSAADESENINVVTDLNNNWDRLDALLSWRPVTSGTVPASAYQGAGVIHTDTSKAYINYGAGGSAATDFRQVMVAGSTFVGDANITGGVSYTTSLAQTSASDTTEALRFKVTGDTENRHIVLTSGYTVWGPGGSTVWDTNLFRSAANTLSTDDSFTVGGNLTVAGSATLDDVILGGNLVIGSSVYRNKPTSVSSALANSTTETAIATLTVPANDASVGAVYRIKAFGTCSVTGTPTLTFRARMGGVAGNGTSLSAITVRSGATDGQWEVEAHMFCTAVGVSGAFHATAKAQHNLITGATTWTPLGPNVTTTAVTANTTGSLDFVVTAQWGTASASNTLTCRGFAAERVA